MVVEWIWSFLIMKMSWRRAALHVRRLTLVTGCTTGLWLLMKRRCQSQLETSSLSERYDHWCYISLQFVFLIRCLHVWLICYYLHNLSFPLWKLGYQTIPSFGFEVLLAKHELQFSCQLFIVANRSCIRCNLPCLSGKSAMLLILDILGCFSLLFPCNFLVS